MIKNIQYKKLGEICDFISGGTPSKSKNEYWKNGNIPWIKISDFKEKYIKYSDEKITKNGLENSSAKLLKKGTILYTIFASVGKVAILDIEATTNQAIVGVNLKENNLVDKDFLYYFLCSIENNIKRQARGVAQNNINISILKNVCIPILPISSQKNIVKTLMRLENILENFKQKKILINFLNKSLFTKYSKNKKVVNLELEKICEFIKDGTHQTPTYVNTNKNGYKFLSSKDVSKGIINWNSTKYISEELHKELYKKIAPQKNDILLAKNGTTGIAALVDKEEIFDIYVSLAILRLKKEYNPKYMLESINSIETNQQFKRSLKGIGVPNLHLKEIKKVKIPIPPIELQNKFAERAEKIEKLSFEIEKSIKEAENLYNSLMNKYFE